MLDITCERCGAVVCRYQKDGPGQLRRMYVDRILAPVMVWKKDWKLTCGACGKWLGICAIWQKEKRPCFILFHDVVRKKTAKK